MIKRYLQVIVSLLILLAGVSLPSAHGMPDDNKQVDPVVSTTFQVFFPSIGREPTPEAHFGFGIQPTHLDASLAAGHIHALGLIWTKIPARWKDIEPQPGLFVWSELDNLVTAYNASGINILLSVAEAPDWARPIDDDKSVVGMPEDPNTYAAFMTQVIGRYAGKVQAVEVWREQNLHYMVGGVGRINPAAYANLLRATYRAVKSTDPNVQVITGGLTPTGAPLPWALDDIEYLAQLYNHNIRGFFDAIGAAPRGYNCPALEDWRTFTDPTAIFQGPFVVRHHSWCFLGPLEGYRGVMVARGDGDKKIAVTAFGWASDANASPQYGFAIDNTLEEQAQWIVEAYQYGKHSGYINLMILFNLDYGLFAPNAEVAYWSMLRQSGPIPAYHAIAAMPK